jgi:hypothetical protein
MTRGEDSGMTACRSAARDAGVLDADNLKVIEDDVESRDALELKLVELNAGDSDAVGGCDDSASSNCTCARAVDVAWDKVAASLFENVVEITGDEGKLAAENEADLDMGALVAAAPELSTILSLSSSMAFMWDRMIARSKGMPINSLPLRTMVIWLARSRSGFSAWS